MYKLTINNNMVIDLETGAYIPFDNGNKDYQAYLEWVALGNTPEPALSEAEILEATKKDLTAAIQLHLDTVAYSHGYDSIISACSYAASTNPFQADGLAFLSWRSACWTHAIQVLADVEAEIIEIPTTQELIAGLPALTI